MHTTAYLRIKSIHLYRYFQMCSDTLFYIFKSFLEGFITSKVNLDNSALLQKDTHTFISNRKVNYPQPFPISPSLLYYKCKVQSNQTSHSFIDNRLYSLTFLIFLHLSYAAVSHTVVRTCDVVYTCDS